MNALLFLKRLAIAASLPGIALMLVAVFVKDEGWFFLALGVGWIVFVWVCHWVISALFAPKSRAS